MPHMYVCEVAKHKATVESIDTNRTQENKEVVFYQVTLKKIVFR